MRADVIYVLERGEIAETGTQHELVGQKGLSCIMWRQQTGERSQPSSRRPESGQGGETHDAR